MGDGFVLVWFKPNSKLPSWNFRFLPTSGSRPPHRFSWIDRSRHAAGCRQASRTAALAPFSENPPPSHKQSSPVHAPEMQCARARRPPRRVGQRIIERDTRRRLMQCSNVAHVVMTAVAGGHRRGDSSASRTATDASVDRHGRAIACDRVSCQIRSRSSLRLLVSLRCAHFIRHRRLQIHAGTDRSMCPRT